MKTKYNSTLSTVEAKGGDQTQNHPMRRKWSALALGGFLFTSIFALPAAPVEAQCKQWSVGHGWRLKQGPTNMDLDLHQNGTVITGTAAFRYSAESKRVGLYIVGGEAGEVHGTVDGTVKGDHFAVHIYWDNNTTGVYEGTIRPSGKIEGKGYEQRSPSKKVNWYSDTRMVCADTAVQPTNPTPKPIGKTGKVPIPTPKPLKSTGKTQSAAVAPFIKANPIGVTIPAGQSQGTTTLTWDAGPDHPDAEVWMRVGGGEETLVVQQGKGTRSMTVEAGNVYGFILKDAGQQLARAAVIAKR